MKVLCEGRAPTQRHDGSIWTQDDLNNRLMTWGGDILEAGLVQCRGDWEWMSQCFRFRHPSAEAFCWMCDAQQSGPLTYLDFTPHAAHRRTLLSHEDYLQRCAIERAQPSFLFRCPGTELQHCAIDSMHAGDLGVFQDALGSLLWCTVSSKQWFRNSAGGLVVVNGMLKSYYSANRSKKFSEIPRAWRCCVLKACVPSK